VSDAPDLQSERRGETERRSWRRWTVAAVVLVAVAFLVVFAIQNTQDAEVSWVFGSTTGPLIFVILASAAAGFVVGVALVLLMRARRRRRG